MQVLLDYRKLWNVLENKKRIDQVTTADEVARPLQKVLRAGDVNEADVIDTIVARSRPGTLNHATRNINPRHRSKMLCERKRQPADAATYFKTNHRTQTMCMHERKELRVHHLLAALPKRLRIGPLHIGEDVQIRIYFGKAFPGGNGRLFVYLRTYIHKYPSPAICCRGRSQLELTQFTSRSPVPIPRFVWLPTRLLQRRDISSQLNSRTIPRT